MIDAKPTGGYAAGQKWEFLDHNLYRPVPSDKEKIMVIADTNICISELYLIEAILYRYRQPGMYANSCL